MNSSLLVLCMLFEIVGLPTFPTGKQGQIDEIMVFKSISISLSCNRR